MLKRLSLLLVVILSLTCLLGASSALGEEAGDYTLPRTLKIGHLTSGTTDSHGSAAKEFLDYAAESIGNIEMMYIPEFQSPEKQIAAVENMIAAGCDGILVCNMTQDNLLKIARVCEEAEVYWAQTWRSVTDPAVQAELDTMEYYLGGSSEDETKTAYNITKALHEIYGAENIAVITKPVGETTHDLRNAGIDQACAEFGMTRVADVRDVNSADETVKAIENFFITIPELDAVFVTSGTNGRLEGAFQAFSQHGKTGEIALACIDFVNQMPMAFENGTIQVIAGGHFNDPYYSLILLVNKLIGTPLSEGPARIDCNMIYVTNVEEANDYCKYIEGDIPMYTQDEIRSMIKLWNPDFTLEDLQAAAHAYSIEDVRERHAELFGE